MLHLFICILIGWKNEHPIRMLKNERNLNFFMEYVPGCTFQSKLKYSLLWVINLNENKQIFFPMLCKCPLSSYVTLFLYFVSLLLTSLYFRSLLEYSAHFCSLQFTSSFWPNLPKNVPDYSSNVTFYWRAMSDSRMFIVPILTWSIRNTLSVNWNLLVRCVATIHKTNYYIYLHNNAHRRFCTFK